MFGGNRFIKSSFRCCQCCAGQTGASCFIINRRDADGEIILNERRSFILSGLFLRLFLPFGLAYFLSVLLGSANAIMSPVLIGEFHLSSSELGFMTSVYLIAFGLAQFPLGVFLDRCGARRTLAPFLLIGAAGCVVFGASQNMVHLVLSRMLLGVGLSGCLMSAFKAYADWLPSDELPLAYSIESLTGGLGGMAASRPLAALFKMADWRVCFMAFAALTALVSLLVWLVPPEKKELKKTGRAVPFTELLRGMLGFLKDRRFWLVAPCVTAAQSVMFAYLYLWVSPWLRDAAMMNDAETGAYMLYACGGAAAGYFLNGVAASWSARVKWLSWENIYLGSGLLMTLMLFVIAAINGRGAAFLWGPVFFLSTMVMISFPLMRRLYNAEEVGRVLSLLNFLIFAVSFAFQWFIGVTLDMFPTVGGHFSPAGYRLSLLIIAVINAAAVAHLYFSLKELRGKNSAVSD